MDIGPPSPTVNKKVDLNNTLRVQKQLELRFIVWTAALRRGTKRVSPPIDSYGYESAFRKFCEETAMTATEGICAGYGF